MNHELRRNIIHRFTDVVESPEEYDARINKAHRLLYAKRFLEGDTDALIPFITVKGYDTPALVVTNGFANLPSDYHRVIDATVVVGGQEKMVEFVEDKEFADRKSNPIELPTNDYPLGNIQGSRARFLPKTIHHVNFTYYRKPETLKFGYTRANGYIQYNPATSVESPWDEVNDIVMLQMVLADMGKDVPIEQIEKAAK